MTSGAEVVNGMSMREYLSLKRLSSGLCHRILSESPLHARLDSPWNESRSQDNSNVADIGSAAHKCLLEGTEDGIAVIEADDWRTKAAKELRDAAYAAGNIPMLIYKMDVVRDMVSSARQFISESELAGILDDGEAEVTLLFEMMGIPCKARCDRLKADRSIVLSYKTTKGSANPDSWIRTQLPQYDIATVFYEEAVHRVFKIPNPACIHLIQQQDYPWACSLVGLDPSYRELAKAKLNSALYLWAACSESGNWPAFSGRVHWAQPRPWDQAEQEEREVNTAFSEDELKGGIPL